LDIITYCIHTQRETQIEREGEREEEEEGRRRRISVHNLILTLNITYPSPITITPSSAACFKNNKFYTKTLQISNFLTLR